MAMRFFRRLLPAALALLSFALPGSALGQAPLSPDKAFALTVTREADGNLAFAWDIAPGHYLYRDHTVASTPGGKESLPLELAAGETKDDPGFGVVDVWHDAGRATLSAQTLTQAGEPTSVNITYQGCLEDSICYPPMTRTIDVPTRPQSDVAAREADAQTAQAAAMLAIQAPGAAPAPENDEGAAAPSPVASSPAVTLDANPGFVDRLALQGGATWVLLAFFGFGVLLAFTPCVFPMYPILAGVIGRGVDGRGTRRGLTLSVAYVLGLSIAFALLGVAAAWS
jgi:thiol:disulfide interchange protein DsbD